MQISFSFLFAIVEELLTGELTVFFFDVLIYTHGHYKDICSSYINVTVINIVLLCVYKWENIVEEVSESISVKRTT